MKKVLLVGPRPSGKGGVCIWVGMVLDYLQEHSNIVSIDLLDSTRSASLTHLLPLYKKLWCAISDYYLVLGKLITRLSKHNYDIVHIVSSGGCGILRDFIFVCIANFFKVTPIVHYHCGTIPLTLKSRSLYSFLLSYVANHSKVIVLDQLSYDVFIEKGYTAVFKIGNAYSPIIDSLYNSCIDRNPLDILFVGHLVPEKGIFELLEALHDIPNINLTCIGCENDFVKQSLLNYISRSGFLGTVKFLGLQDSLTVYTAMVKSGLFVLPTYSEGFPFVIVEAMASGCPIISTPVGAIEEMLTYKGAIQGFLVTPKDPKNLKSTILQCFSSYPSLIEKAVNARTKAVANYSVDSIMTKLIALWNSCS